MASTTFHKARVDLARAFAREGLRHVIVKCYGFRWEDAESCIETYVQAWVKPFIESGDIASVRASSRLDENGIMQVDIAIEQAPIIEIDAVFKL